VLAGFHPTIAAWFTDTLGTTSQLQQQGWPRIRQGGHVLIAAPTGPSRCSSRPRTCLNDLGKGLRMPQWSRTAVPLG
jgi:ATP-dependent Lhr-like helicase